MQTIPYNPADTPHDYSVMYKVACCLHKAASRALENAGLRVPAAGGVTHKLDGEFACEDCEGLWTWWDQTLGDDGEFSPACKIEYVRQFRILLAWNVCTEQLTPCYDPDSVAGDCGDNGDCPEPPEPAIGSPGDCDSSALTVGEETAWIYAARYAIERDMPGLLCECLGPDCAAIGRCKSVSPSIVTPSIQGGCAFVEFSVELKW